MVVRGYLFMATIQIQSVSAASPAPSGSNIVGNASGDEDSFALTLGRAFENATASAQNGRASAPVGMAASPGSSRSLNATEAANTTSASAASVLLNCFAANLVQTAPMAAQTSPEDFSLQLPTNTTSLPDLPVESTGHSGVNGGAGSGASAKEEGIIPNANSLPAGVETLATPGAKLVGKGQGVKPSLTTAAATRKPNPSSRRPVAGQSTSVVLATAQVPAAPITSFQSSRALTTPAANPDLQAASQPEDASAQAWSQEFPTASFRSQPMSPGSIQAAARVQQDRSTSNPSAGASVAPAWHWDYHEISNSNQPMGTASGPASFSPASAATLAPSASVNSNYSHWVEASISQSAPVINFPSTTTALPSETASTAARTQSPNPTSTSESVTTQGPDNSSSPSDTIPPIEQFDPPQGQEIAQLTSTPVQPIAIDAASSATQPSQAAASRVPTTQSLASSSQTRPSGPPEYEALFENLPDSEASAQASENSVAQTGPPAKPSVGIEPSTAPTRTNDESRTNAATAPSQSTAKSGDSAAGTTRAATHSLQASANVPADSSWQQFIELGGAAAQILSTSSAAPTASPQAGSKSPLVSTADSPQTPASAAPAQSSGATPDNSSDAASSSSSGDSPAAGQSKTGQQYASSSAGNPLAVIASTPATSVSPATGASTNPLMVSPPYVPTNHAGVSTPQTPQTPAQPPANLSAWQNYDGGPGKIVQSASLNNSVAGGEMHLELRTSPLGPLEIHTVVHDGSVGAEIHVQGPEAHTLLTAGLPSLERALGQQNLRVQNLSVYQDASGGGMGTGGGQDPQSGSHPSMQRQTLPWDSSPQPSIPSSGSLEEEELTIPATGLSIRA